MTKELEEKLEQALRTVVDERGGVSMAGGTYVLTQRDMLANLQKVVEEIMGRGAEGLLMRAGYARGQEIISSLLPALGEHEAAVLEGLRLFGRKTGQFTIEAWDVRGERLDVRVSGSAVGVGYGSSDRPVCHYICGVLLAVGERVLGRSGLECRESRCVATGAPECAFSIRPGLVLAAPLAALGGE